MTNEDSPSTDDDATGAPPLTTKRLNAMIGYFASVVVACAVIMWSVFNTWLNVLAYRANESNEQSWGIAAIMVAVTCVIPFLIGIAILLKAIGKNPKRP